MRHVFAGFVVCVGLAVVCAGCGSGKAAERLVGTYAVMIDAAGTADPDTMTASIGARGTVLLNFVFGFSQLRGEVDDTAIQILPQTVRVQHSTGVMAGSGAGQGTIDGQGMVDLTLTVTPAGGSDGGAGESRSFRVTGQRN